jgi:hypothetical protein
MPDRNQHKNSPPLNPPKFRRHPHPHGHHSINTWSQQPAQLQDVSITFDAPRDSNELFIVDVFDGGEVAGKEGHTSVAIYSSSSLIPTSSTNQKQQPINPPTTASQNKKTPIKIWPTPKNINSFALSKAQSSYIDDIGDDTSSFRILSPTRKFKNNKNKWGSDDEPDTQETANDTFDLDRIMPSSPLFRVHFNHNNEKELSVHVGLRKKYNHVPFINQSGKTLSSSFTMPPNTDDYNMELFRYLKNNKQTTFSSSKLKILKFILELPTEDDVLVYKTFDDQNQQQQPNFKVGLEKNFEILIQDGDFPVIRSHLGTFWTSKNISNEITHLHVELPGLSQFYLNDWKRLLELQTQLITLICNFGAVLWTFYSNVVKNNENSLNKVVLRRVISYDVLAQKQLPLDFAIFKNCSKLSYLKVFMHLSTK